MLNLPRNTHRYFLEPISMTRHVTFSLYLRFLKFIDRIGSCRKSAMTTLLNTIKYDCQSRTCSNLREIMLMTSKNDVDVIDREDIKTFLYNEIPRNCEWKINIVNELIDYKSGIVMVPGFQHSKLKEMLNHICTS